MAPSPEAASFVWQPAERLDSGNDRAVAFPQLAMNRQGAGILVWRQRNSQDLLEARARTVSVNGAPGLVVSLGLVGSEIPNVAIDEQGRALAVWSRGTAENSEIWAGMYDPRTGWEASQRVSAPEAGVVTKPRAAITETGDMAVVWLQNEGGNQVYAGRYSVAQGWEAPVRLDSASSSASEPRVSFDSNGRTVVVWSQGSAQDAPSVWANRIEPDGTVGTAVQIEQSTGNSNTPSLVKLGNGSLQAVWQQASEFQGQNQQIAMNRWLPSSGWSTATSVSDVNTGSARSPYLAPWGTDNAVTAWVQPNGDRTEVWANRIVQGQAGEPQALQGGLIQGQDHVRIGADDQGNAIGMWIRSEVGVLTRVGIATTLWATGWPVAGAPGEAIRLDASADTVVYEAELGVDAQGRALAVWTQNDGSGRQLWLRRYVAP